MGLHQVDGANQVVLSDVHVGRQHANAVDRGGAINDDAVVIENQRTLVVRTSYAANYRSCTFYTCGLMLLHVGVPRRHANDFSLLIRRRLSYK